MKDLYSFHASESDFAHFYEEAKAAYFRIFERCGLKAIYTLAGGGVFTAENTNEFQVIAPIGEDTIYMCDKCEYAENKEVASLKDGSKCLKCGGKVKEEKSIEVGNIFPLGSKYSEALNLKYADESGEKKHVIMGSYGIGLGRLMGTAVEVHNDKDGIIWPKNIAPFAMHLISLGEEAKEKADEIYETLNKDKVDVFYDDRADKTAGEKFADAYLICIPLRVVVSKKTMEKDYVEIKKLGSNEAELVKIYKILDYAG